MATSFDTLGHPRWERKSDKPRVGQSFPQKCGATTPCVYGFRETNKQKSRVRLTVKRQHGREIFCWRLHANRTAVGEGLEPSVVETTAEYKSAAFTNSANPPRRVGQARSHDRAALLDGSTTYAYDDGSFRCTRFCLQHRTIPKGDGNESTHLQTQKTTGALEYP